MRRVTSGAWLRKQRHTFGFSFLLWFLPSELSLFLMTAAVLQRRNGSQGLKEYYLSHHFNSAIWDSSVPLTRLNYQESSLKEEYLSYVLHLRQASSRHFMGKENSSLYKSVWQKILFNLVVKWPEKKMWGQNRQLSRFLQVSSCVFLNLFEILLTPRKVTLQFKYKFQKALKNHGFLTFDVFDIGPPLFSLVKEYKAH